MHKKITTKFITDFSRQLCTLINSGIPILSAFNIIEQSCEHQSFSILIKKIKADLESGNTLAMAFKNKSHHFDGLFCNSGTLDIILRYIADYKEKNDELKRKVKKALLYPIVILGVASIVSVILLIFVVPQFENLYESFSAKLPLPTQLVINLARITKTYSLLFIMIIVTGITAFRFYYKRNHNLVMILDKIILKLPIFGILIQKAIIARFTRMLAITSAAGLSLRKSLQSIAAIIDNNIYKQAVVQIRDFVSAGQSIAAAIRHNKLFPNRVIQMVTIGEESGSLENMLAKIADYYESEVNYFIDNLHDLLEPIIIIILGILIGGLLISMYLPIFRLGALGTLGAI
jgi:type IV pilus assembly protein PilC